MFYKRFRLVESLSASTEEAFKSIYEKLWSCLKDVADIINNDSKDSDDKNMLVKSVQQTITDMLVALNTSTSDSVTKQAFQKCKAALSELQQSPWLKSIKPDSEFVAMSDKNLYSALNTAVNSLNSISEEQLVANNYSGIKDPLVKLQTACTEKTVDTDQNLDRETLNRTGYILQWAKKAVDTNDLNLTDTVVTDFISECKDLLQQLGSKNWQILKEFNKQWDDKFAKSFSSDQTSTSLTDKSDNLEIIGNQKRDWAKDFAKASASESNQLWQEFLKAEFGKNADFVAQLGQNVQYECEQHGYSTETNPYLYFIKYSALDNNQARLPLTAISFYHIAYAESMRKLGLSDLMAKPDTSLNIINCKQFYSQSPEIMSKLLSLQHLFKTEQVVVSSAILQSPVLGPWLRKLGKHVDDRFKLSSIEVADLLYSDYSAGVSSSYNLKLNPVQAQQDAANLLFGFDTTARYSTAVTNTLDQLRTTILRNSQSEISSLWPDLLDNINTRQADLLVMLTLVYYTGHNTGNKLGKEADELQTWEPKNKKTVEYLDTNFGYSSVAKALKSTRVEKVLESILKNAHQLNQFNLTADSITQLLKQLDHRIAESKPLSDKD